MSDLLPVFIIIIISSSSIHVYQPVVMVTCNQEQARGCIRYVSQLSKLWEVCALRIFLWSRVSPHTIRGLCYLHCLVAVKFVGLPELIIPYGASMDVNFNNFNVCLLRIANTLRFRSQLRWPHNLAQFEFSLSSAGYLTLTRSSFPVTSENITWPTPQN